MNNKRAYNKELWVMGSHYKASTCSTGSGLIVLPHTLRSLLLVFGFVLMSLIISSNARALAVKAQMSDLCFKCHPKLQESMSQKYVHFPFKQGKCGACHDMHVSNNKGLIRDDINSICLSCHENVKNLMKKAAIHGALKKGTCSDCHYSHSSGNKYLLVKTERDLCWSCHENLKDQLNKPYIHAPFKGGECGSCHNPHASSEENQLLASPNKVCKTCHAPRCKVNGVPISSYTKEMNCNSCHSGHSTDSKGLLGPYGHTAFLTKNCEQCHNPIVADRKITTKADGEKLCFSCHKKESGKFRDNDVHGDGNSKNACIMCHSTHASKNKALTVNESKLCFNCHESIDKKITAMGKALKGIKCIPVKNRKCFECHTPMHSTQQYYFRSDKIATCARCHAVQHKITHPLGEGVIDPRNGQPVVCISCHSMHDAKAEFMLTYDRKRQLCIQCHNK